MGSPRPIASHSHQRCARIAQSLCSRALRTHRSDGYLYLCRVHRAIGQLRSCQLWRRARKQGGYRSLWKKADVIRCNGTHEVYTSRNSMSMLQVEQGVPYATRIRLDGHRHNDSIAPLCLVHSSIRSMLNDVSTKYLDSGFSR